jgi:hypothetical protein
MGNDQPDADVSRVQGACRRRRAKRRGWLRGSYHQMGMQKRPAKTPRRASAERLQSQFRGHSASPLLTGEALTYSYIGI